MPSAVSHCSRCSSPFGFKLSCWTYEGFHCSSPYLRVNYITPNIMYVVWSVFRCFRRAVYKVGQILPISNWFSFLYWNALIWWLILIALSIYGSRWDCVIKDALTQHLRSPLQTGSPLFASVWLSSHFCTLKPGAPLQGQAWVRVQVFAWRSGYILLCRTKLVNEGLCATSL